MVVILHFREGPGEEGEVAFPDAGRLGGQDRDEALIGRREGDRLVRQEEEPLERRCLEQLGGAGRHRLGLSPMIGLPQFIHRLAEWAHQRHISDFIGLHRVRQLVAGQRERDEMYTVDDAPWRVLHLMHAQEPRLHQAAQVFPHRQRSRQAVPPFFRIVDEIVRHRLIRDDVRDRKPPAWTDDPVHLAEHLGLVRREMYRVIRPGGRFTISDIVADQPVPNYLIHDTEKWGDCLSGALPVWEYLRGLVQAGFLGVHQMKYSPWSVIDGFHFVSLTLTGYKLPNAVEPNEVGYVTLVGPFSRAVDELGQTYHRGKPQPVSAGTGQLLKPPPFYRLFFLSDQPVSLPATDQH